MANSYTSADVNQILNNPGIFHFRGYGSSDSYTKSVFTNGAEFNYTPEITSVGFDDTGEVFDAIGKETGEVKFSFGKPFDLDFMSILSGGLFTKTTTSAGDQAVVNQTITAGWTNTKPIQIDLIDTDGVYYIANGAPAITSVTASGAAGALTANDDYTIIEDEGSYTGYSIVFNTAGGKSVTTVQSIVIIFNDPTVVGQETLSGGGIKNYNAIEGYFETILKDDSVARVNFFKGYYNGNINLTFGTEESPEAAVTDVTISLKKDGARASGSQVFSLQKGV